MKIEIKSWLDNSILFEHSCENNTFKITVEEAVKQKINLNYANMINANMINANMDVSKAPVMSNDFIAEVLKR